MAVHPIEFGIVTRDRDVREYQVLQERSFLRILVVPRREASGGLETRLRHAVSRRLAELGVEEPQVTVERREELARSSGGAKSHSIERCAKLRRGLPESVI